MGSGHDPEEISRLLHALSLEKDNIAFITGKYFHLSSPVII